MTKPSPLVNQSNKATGMRSFARALGTALVRWGHGMDDTGSLKSTSSAAPLQAEKPKDRAWVEQFVALSGTTALDLRGVDLSGADLSNLDLSGTNFQNANLAKVSLRSAHLVGADLRNANCQNSNFLDADLRRALFYGANLHNVRFSAYSFRSCPMRFRPDWMIGDHGMARRTDEIADYHRARETVLSIARALHDQGHFDEAATFRVLALRIDRATNSPLRRARMYRREGVRWLPQWPSLVRRTLRWTGSISVDLLCVYGESVWRVLLWMTVVLLGVGPLSVLLTGGLDWPSEAAVAYFQLNSVWRQALYAYSQYVLYMFDTFTTADFSLMQPHNDVVRLFSGVLAMTGIFLTGLLGFVAGNRIRRI